MSHGSWCKVPALHILAQKMAERDHRHVGLGAKADAVAFPLPVGVDEPKKPTVKNLQAGKHVVEEGKVVETEKHTKEKRRSKKVHGKFLGNNCLIHTRGDAHTGEPVYSDCGTEVFHETVIKAESAEETLSHKLTHGSKLLSSDSAGMEIHDSSEQPCCQINASTGLVPSNSGTSTQIGPSGAGDSDPVGNKNPTLQALDTVEFSADMTPAELDSTFPFIPASSVTEEVMEDNLRIPGGTINAKSQGEADFVDTCILSNKKKQNQDSESSICGTEIPMSIMDDPSFSKTTQKSAGARNRWRRLKHTVSFANHLALNSRSASRYVAEEKIVEDLLQPPQFSAKEDVGGVGAAIFEGTKTGPRLRVKGRKGMEAMLVRQEKSIINFLQDFYVACLKMPIGHFLTGVFLAPVLLGLFFTPMYIFDLNGLAFDDGAGESKLICALISTTKKCFQYLNVFLYALSLSTTFGGSPVVAHSPYCILVANVNTLMAQFLFVFLSGAVFARMSHPSHPIRCSKKAIIRNEDFVPTVGVDYKENFRVFAVRLVLTGPAPCELVDAKICLTFRIFVKLPTGATFCATQDLELVRPEVSYLRYGIMVRHVINKKSPLYGHTMESLVEGDASFSLTIMGFERTSMQPVFHLEDYFVCDSDVEWDGDYVDFVETNEKGQRVLNHSKIDLLRTFKVAGVVAQAISRMEANAARHRRKMAVNKGDSSEDAI
ncbi:hypothetical protein O6H91_04G111300 [Diphasiastrum complanatum]|uniref:Uncharacterized protein n=2 Tax=Diphasiastrum complanatum TaxID=34168 RepID=A0ACC2E0T5_DIPCM|nr:hypothetical protein O6H91_04G111300 [Diphasiastrum complanatum]KAJ7560037.1 hypothetical protein O6H91_04G111300 [Diphasiastrum complanatum]